MAGFFLTQKLCICTSIYNKLFVGLKNIFWLKHHATFFDMSFKEVFFPTDSLVRDAHFIFAVVFIFHWNSILASLSLSLSEKKLWHTLNVIWIRERGNGRWISFFCAEIHSDTKLCSFSKHCSWVVGEKEHLSAQHFKTCHT